MVQYFLRHLHFIDQAFPSAVSPAPTFCMPRRMRPPSAPYRGMSSKFVIDEVVQGMLKGAWKKLPFEINGNKPRAGGDSLVTGHTSP